MQNNPAAQDEVLSFDKLINARTRRWAKAYDDANIPRLREAVTMEKRYRSDYFGFFHSNQKSLEWVGMLGKGLVTYPVIMRAVRAKLAQSLNTNIKLKIEPVRNEPELEAAAELAQNLYEYLCRELWTEQLECTISHIPQIARCCFLRTQHSASGGAAYEQAIFAARTIKTADDLFLCGNCGAEVYGDDFSAPGGLIENEPLPDYSDTSSGFSDTTFDKFSGSESLSADKMSTFSDNLSGEFEKLNDNLPFGAPDNVPICPHCAAPMVQHAAAEFAEMNLPTGEYEQKQTGALSVEAITPFLMRVDEFNAVGFNLNKAHFLNYHPLVPLYEIHHEFPHLKDKIAGGNVTRWSDAARWYYELTKHSGNAGAQTHWENRTGLDELTELNHWWIQPVACHGWQSPDYFPLKNKQGEIYFDIEPGETIEAAFTRRDGYFAGLEVVMCEDEILTVENRDFNREWSAVGWFINPHSFFPEGEERLLKLQDAATNVFTLVYDHVKRCSNPKLVYNPMLFDEKRLKSSQPGDLLGMLQQISPEQLAGIDKQIFYLSPAQLSGDAYNFINILREIIKEESGVNDEMLGNSDTTNQTLGGKNLAVSRNLALLTPPMKAKKAAKIEWAYLALQLFQEKMPDAAYRSVKGTFDEEWKAQDIHAFRAASVRQDFKIQAIEGSDVPKTLPEMQEKFLAALQLGLLNKPDASNPLDPAVQAKIVKDVLGIDFDVNNFEADRRLAAQRLKFIKQMLKQVGKDVSFVIQNNQPALDPFILQTIDANPQTQVRQLEDNHQTFIQYYTDQIKGLAAQDNPDAVLIQVLEHQISAHLRAETMRASTLAALAGLQQSAASAASAAGQNVLFPEQTIHHEQ